MCQTQLDELLGVSTTLVGVGHTPAHDVELGTDTTVVEVLKHLKSADHPVGTLPAGHGQPRLVLRYGSRRTTVGAKTNVVATEET